jgi:predicted nucleic acid-binding protein
MKKPQLYLETSVWNFYFANDAPEKREITLRFFDKVKQDEYEIFISDVVIEEIGRADDNKKRSLLNIIAESSPMRLISDEEVAELAQKYT